MYQLFSILIFPGILFLVIFSLLAEYLDRIIYARLQNRQGPPWFQPFADFIKLIAKEELIPTEANKTMFTLAPLFALTAVIVPIFYIPVTGMQALYSFRGDIVAVLYLLTIPTLAFFIGGWYSTSLYARIGSVRAITQLFAYEVPLFMGILAPALLANTWSISEMTVFYSAHPLYTVVNIIGFAVSLVALLGKLEKTPFDIPEAETEIVAGSFTEYSGKRLAFFRLAIDIEAIVGAALIAAVFLPFGLGLGHKWIFVLFIVKVLFVIELLALMRTVVARLRIDQMIDFCWKYAAPAALVQILINLLLKLVLLK
ncbi:MAG: NADH-quinone oxidoreductase subunit H [Candidatus Omnitrophica bacterium]|nr:NADH-quinone oxidoreductase subunit H [Candidatus Omnitrophota bacterium]